MGFIKTLFELWRQDLDGWMNNEGKISFVEALKVSYIIYFKCL